MDGTRFDAFSKTVAARYSRRTTLKRGVLGFGASVFGAGALRSAQAHDATPVASPEAAEGEQEFLFVQIATSGTFTANNGAGTPTVDGTPTPGGGADFVLTLEGHTGGTIYFSDRPQRIFGESPTADFLDGLGFTPDNPPNAALVVHGEDGTDDIAVLELLNPTYEAETGTLTYGATILGEYEDGGLAFAASQQQDNIVPESFERASLFIDDCSDKYIYCLSSPVETPGFSPNDIGNHGFCYSWSQVQCLPCGGGWSAMTQMCNDNNPGCNGFCEASADGPEG